MGEREKPSETCLSYSRVFQKLGPSVQSNGASGAGGLNITGFPPDADVPNISRLTPDHVDFRPGAGVKTTPDSYLGARERTCISETKPPRRRDNVRKESEICEGFGGTVGQAECLSSLACGQLEAGTPFFLLPPPTNSSVFSVFCFRSQSCVPLLF